MEGNLYYLLKSFLVREHFAINYAELKLQLLSHPSYPSLHSVTGVLDHFGIDNMALEVPNNRETYDQLPDNFIAHITQKNSKQFSLVSKKKNHVEVLFENKKKQKLTLKEFLAIWQGIIVVIENPDKASSKANIALNLNSVLLFSLSILMLGFFLYTNPNIYQLSGLLLSLAGLYISSLIVQQELGYHSSTLNKICGNTETTSCNEVLNSQGALLFNKFKLSDLSVVYFTAISIYWALSLFKVITTNYSFIILSFLALPITVYSIYYQFKVVKKWCLLCLGVVAILWLQCCTIVFTNFSFESIKLSNKDNFILFFSFISAIALWILLKPLLKSQKSSNELRIEHFKFKRNYSVFNTLLNKGNFITPTLVDAKEIILGNKNAAVTILIVTNPSCFYCKEAHTDIEHILETTKGSLKVIVRFSVPEDAKNPATQIAARLLEIYDTKKYQHDIRAALEEVYSKNVDFEKWQIKWGKTENKEYIRTLNKQRTWCHENAINFTPAFFVNGREFPKEYERNDLKYFIEDMIEANEDQKRVELKSVEKVN